MATETAYKDGPGLKLRLIVAVASGRSVRAASRDLAIPRSTARRWVASPEFKAGVEKARGAMVDKAIGRLTRHAAKAVDAAAGLLKSDDDNVRLRAASTLLGKLLDVQGHYDLLKRVEALEAAATREGMGP